MKLKSKFSLRNTKYGLPLILLPIFVLLAYVVSDIFPPKEEKSAAEQEQLEGINSNLPDPTLSTQQDKFTLLQRLLEQRKKETGLKDIEDELANFMSEEEESPGRDLESIINPVSDSLKEDKSQIKADSEEALLVLQHKYFPNNAEFFAQNIPKEQPKSQQADELAMMRQQLAIMDSMMRAQASEKANEVNEAVQKEEEKILEAKKADSKKSNAFNTLTGDKKKSFITAILDEAQTVVDGSRIRIRLLDDIFIGDYLFPKGSYLYGLVSGFTAQRVMITITTVLYGDRILKTNLSLYDYDGIKGLYVPNSNFREMMRQAGSRMAQSNNVNINSSQNAMQQFMTQAGQDLYRSVTQAVSSRIRQNKAKLKYASQIYLINEDAEQQNQQQTFYFPNAY
jgi:conjugative transposon TraM protein